MKCKCTDKDGVNEAVKVYNLIIIWNVNITIINTEIPKLTKFIIWSLYEM